MTVTPDTKAMTITPDTRDMTITPDTRTMVAETNTRTMTNGMAMTNTNECHLSVETFNCHGLKQSSQYIAERLQENDILCLTETWLRPDEDIILESSFNKSKSYDIFSKSGMVDTDIYHIVDVLLVE